VAHRLTTTALILPLAVAGCSARTDDDLGSGREPVVGGFLERGLESAGYLVREGATSCTAVLIEPDLVLTAGHCVVGHHDIEFGWGQVAEHRTVRSVAYAVHPRYIHPPPNGGVTFQGHDVALIRLERPAGVAPSPLGSAPPHARVRGVGYGAVAYVAGAGGALQPHGAGTERRSLDGLVRGENETELFVRFDPGSSACYGDSGGPLFTMNGAVVAILSRFTERGRCLPRDRSIMGYVRVDAMSAFLREARACMREPDVQACLRDDRRGLCAPPRLDTKATTTLTPSAGGAQEETIHLAERESRTLTVTPEADVVLTLDADGDARMRALRERAPIATQVTHVALQGGARYEIVVGSCNGEAQSVVLRWRRPGAATAMGVLRGG
jgi:hypothetical protein